MVRKTAWPIRSMKVVNLRLDERNVRLDSPGASQAAIINDLLMNEDGYELVKDIVANGYFDHDLPVVTKEGHHYVVLEGNRRVAALKAILQPSCAPAFEARIKSLIGTTSVDDVAEIDVKVSPDRDSAALLISSIHTTQARRPWLPLRQAYFYYAQVESGRRSVDDLINEYPSVHIPTFITMWEMHQIAKSVELPDEKSQRAVNSRSFPITNLQRMYENEAFRDQLGLGFDSNGSVQISSDREDFNRAMAQVVTDIVNKEITSRTMNTDTQIQAYLAKLPEVGKSESTSLPPTTVSDFTPIPPPPPPGSRHLIHSSVHCNLNAPAVTRRLEELKKLRYETYPNTTMDALRTLLEVSLKVFLKNEGITFQNARGEERDVHLSELLTRTVGVLDQQNLRSLKDVAQRLQNKQNDTVAKRLNSANHNEHTFETADSVRDAWDAMNALVVHALSQEVKNAPTP